MKKRGSEIMSVLKEKACIMAFKRVYEVLEKVEKTQMDNIMKAADVITETIMNGRWVYTFGTGHSASVALEPYFRAGSLFAIDSLVDHALTPISGIATPAERLEGFASILLDHRKVSKGDTVIIVSNSGRNSTIVECAIEAKKRGLNVIAITALAHSKAVTPRHPSGKRLFELSDIVIDNGSIFGDCLLDVGAPSKVVPTAVQVGCTIMHAIVAQVVQNLVERGVEPPVPWSANIPGADEHNKKLLEKYLHSKTYAPY